MSADTLIVGAGVCGLVLARELSGKVIILEKSRGVGGRIATKRIDGHGLDHGAPFLASLPDLQSLFPTFHEQSGSLLALGGMTSFPKSLAGSVDVRKEERVEKFSFADHRWTVTTDKGMNYETKRLVLTCPLPQSLELLRKNHISYDASLDDLAYTKALMALILVDHLPELGALHPELHSVLIMKERGLHPQGIVVRATPSYSASHFDESDENNLTALLERFFASLKTRPELTHQELRKWRYVLPERALGTDFYQVCEGLYLAGDAFRIPDVRGALLSAKALARALKD